MSRLQTLSWTAFTLFLGALIFGIRNLDTPVLQIDLVYYVYTLFLVALRFKLALDDHFYFGVTLLGRWQSVLGLLFAVVSWFFFVFTAYTMSALSDSYLLLLIAVGVSTLWITIIAINEGFYREQLTWLISNALYMIGAGFLLWESKTPSYPTAPILDSLVRSPITPIAVIAMMSAVLVVDYKKSESLKHALS